MMQEERNASSGAPTFLPGKRRGSLDPPDSNYITSTFKQDHEPRIIPLYFTRVALASIHTSLCIPVQMRGTASQGSLSTIHNEIDFTVGQASIAQCVFGFPPRGISEA